MSKIFNKLTQEEQNMIETYINAYAFEESGTMHAEVEYVLRYWDEAKYSNLWDTFGEKFILEKEITCNKSIEDIQDDIEEVFGAYWLGDDIERVPMHNRFLYLYNKKLTDSWWSNENTCLVRDENAQRYFRRLIDYKNLATNRYEGPQTIELPTPSGKNIRVNKGAKITKVLAKIAEAYDIPYYEEFRIKHSQILNQKKLTGILCLSIHPLDYMTMSDNECGWDSCMNWRDQGCYCQGTVEMMNSDVVVVAYLKSNKSELFFGNEYRWNSKKWRTLIIASPEIITEIKSYPYRNNELSKYALEWMKELMDPEGNHYDKNLYTIGEDCCIEVPDDFGNSFAISCNFETNYMYNDFGRGDSLCYLSNEVLNEEDTIELNYSGQSECMSCGGAYYLQENKLVCEDCECVYYCDFCDGAVSEEDLHEVDGNYLCENCFYDHASYNELDYEHHLDDNYESVYLRYEQDGKKYLSVASYDVYYDYINNDSNYSKSIVSKIANDKMIHSIKVPAGKYSYFTYNYIDIADATDFFLEELCLDRTEYLNYVKPYICITDEMEKVVQEF